MDELRFLTPGIPLSSKPKSMESGLRRVKELGLDGMEIEYVRGVILDYPKLRELGKTAKGLKLTLTAHAPYYINLYAKEKEKVDKSYGYILDTARALDAAGGYSIVFHAAYYLDRKPEDVYPAVLQHLINLSSIAKKEALRVWLRPELMGKRSQFGTLDEIIRLSKEAGKNVLPCVDFAHLHARTAAYNNYESFAEVFETIGKNLGDEALKNMHMHFSGIAYTDKGEQKHLILRRSDMRYREFIKALVDYDICGALVCESPNGEGDALLLKRTWLSMR
jgi:deoxyribonuclease IV